MTYHKQSPVSAKVPTHLKKLKETTDVTIVL